jgi:ribonucleotide monophosphatase NagD (HAD superfamily)
MTIDPSPETADTFTVHESISDEIIQKYDGFILDQFGVMHNGTSGLPGAPACVQALQDQGKKIIILSNSSALAVSTMAKLPKLGFDPDHFVGAVTSGQEASQFIQETYGGGGGGTAADGNKKALFFTWKTSTPPKTPSPAAVFLNECGGITPVAMEHVETADFILLHGCNVLRGPGVDGQAVETDLGAFSDQADFSVVDPILNKCAAAAIPMICANPDFICIRPDGSIANMPGKIAARYEAMGGVVTSFGKPHQEHFEACVRELGLPKDKVVHIGDSLHHDIAGANAAGIDSILVTGGVHLEELECELDEVPGDEALKELFAQHGETPTYVVPMLKL